MDFDFFMKAMHHVGLKPMVIDENTEFPPMIDLTEVPELLIQINDAPTGINVWVNGPDGCLFRAYRVGTVTVSDMRTPAQAPLPATVEPKQEGATASRSVAPPIHRPVAFRYRWQDSNAIGITTDEATAQRRSNGDYEGLYLRDGS